MHIVIDGRNRRSSTGRYTNQLVEHLQNVESPHTYTILVEAGDSWQMQNKQFRTEVFDFPQFSLSPRHQYASARQLRTLKPDLIHFTMTQQPLFYTGRTVTTTHDLTFVHSPRLDKFPFLLRQPMYLLYRCMFWWSHKKSNQIIVPTKYVAHDLAKLEPFTKHKTTVTYEAATPLQASAAKKVVGVDRPFIMHAGVPFPHKNIARLVQAFERLSATHPDLQLVLVGKKERYFNKLIANSVAHSPVKEKIIIPGFVSNAELRWLYENAAVYVLPALSEGFGLPGLEAMQYNLPVASSNATCLPEVYKDAAQYFDPLDVGDMAEKIAEILDDPKLAESLAARGNKLVKTYSWKRMAEQTLAVFEKVLADPEK